LFFFLLALDLLTIAATAAAAWLWYRASSSMIRRVTRGEDLDAADLNRIIVAINRAQILNSRAALATAASAALVSLRLSIAWVQMMV
jgi:hypothetical protein